MTVFGFMRIIPVSCCLGILDRKLPDAQIQPEDEDPFATKEGRIESARFARRVAALATGTHRS